MLQSALLGGVYERKACEFVGFIRSHPVHGGGTRTCVECVDCHPLRCKARDDSGNRSRVTRAQGSVDSIERILARGALAGDEERHLGGADGS